MMDRGMECFKKEKREKSHRRRWRQWVTRISAATRVSESRPRRIVWTPFEVSSVVKDYRKLSSAFEQK
jgi:hypothetical protein